MANVKILGNSATIFSALTLTQINKAKKFVPESLSLVDKDDNETFSIDFSKRGAGSYTPYGVVFNAEKEDGTVFLTLFNDKSNFTQDAALEDFGPTLLNLNKVEAKVITALANLQEDLQTVTNSVEIL